MFQSSASVWSDAGHIPSIGTTLTIRSHRFALRNGWKSCVVILPDALLIHPFQTPRMNRVSLVCFGFDYILLLRTWYAFYDCHEGVRNMQTYDSAG